MNVNVNVFQCKIGYKSRYNPFVHIYHVSNEFTMACTLGMHVSI